MKRPEGFDPPGRAQPTPAPKRGASARKPAEPPARRTEVQKHQTHPLQPEQPPVGPTPHGPTANRAARPRSPRPDAAARTELRRAARDRKRFERAEVRRFTRRARNRRVGIAVVAGTIITLIALVFGAIFSPVLALRDIRVDGTARVSSDEVVAAVNSQLGTPLALLDLDKMTRELGAFPLIRSYVTEIVPPGTLVIHIVERQPVGTMLLNGTYNLVDPAGVTVETSPDRTPGVPLIDIGAAAPSSPQFDAVVEVLVSLPPSLLAQVDVATATTQDDVSLVLTGVGQRVTWGSAAQSAQKATLLAALIAVTDPSLPGEFDVSAPNNGVFRPL